jgi:nitrous oxidase accessory protein
MNRMSVILRIFVLVCFVLLGIGYASASTIVVNKTYPANTSGDFYYDTIREAVEIAEDGDTIVVCPGIYRDNIVVDKSVIILSSYAGASDTVLSAVDKSCSVFHVTADHVTISGFTVEF